MIFQGIADTVLFALSARTESTSIWFPLSVLILHVFPSPMSNGHSDGQPPLQGVFPPPSRTGFVHRSPLKTFHWRAESVASRFSIGPRRRGSGARNPIRMRLSAAFNAFKYHILYNFLYFTFSFVSDFILYLLSYIVLICLSSKNYFRRFEICI